MTDAFDDAWELFLKRQAELGEWDADFPSTMGPVVQYHGKKLTPERRLDILREGIHPYDTREAQIGSGRYQQDEMDYDPVTGEPIGGGTTVDRWNRDIPESVSITPSSSTAENYAYENRHHSRTAEPTVYGVRVGALANQLPLDEPRRRYGARGGLQDNPEFYTGPNTYRYIAGSIDPRALVGMTPDRARAHDLGSVDTQGNPEHRAGEFETHGPTGAYQQAWAAHQLNRPPEADKLDVYATPEGTQYMKEGFTGAFTAQEQFVDDALAQWQAQQAAMAAPAQPPVDTTPTTTQTRLTDVFQRGESMFNEAWDMIEKAVIPQSVNPVAGYSRATLARPEEAPEEWGQRYSIMNERRPLPHIAAAEHGPQAQSLNFMPPEALQQHEMGRGQLHEWQDLTARPSGTRQFSLGREPINIPRQRGEFPLSLASVRDFSEQTGVDPQELVRAVLEGRGPIVEQETMPLNFRQNVPFFGERQWPAPKGRAGLGWVPREGSGGQLSWHPASGASQGLMTEFGERDDAEGLGGPAAGYAGQPIHGRGSPRVEDISIDPRLRRQGIGTDLVDTYRYIMGLYGFGQEDLTRTPLETVDSREFWDRYFNARWGPQDTNIPELEEGDDVWLTDVNEPMNERRLEVGEVIPGHTGAITGTEEMRRVGTEVQNYPDPGKPSPLPMLPESNQFVQALKQPEEFLQGMPQERREVERLTPVTRTNRWLARQAAGELEPREIVPGVGIEDIVGKYPFIDWEA